MVFHPTDVVFAKSSRAASSAAKIEQESEDGEERPELHAMQVLSEVAPVAELAFPASHARQVSTEVADWVELRVWFPG